MNVVRQPCQPLGERALTVAERAAAWRRRHPDRARQVSADARQRRRDRLAVLKADQGCTRCGIDDPRVLDFHHHDAAAKVLAVSQLVARASWAAVLDEIAKCDVVCANCHRIIEHELAAVGAVA